MAPPILQNEPLSDCCWSADPFAVRGPFCSSMTTRYVAIRFVPMMLPEGPDDVML